MRRLLRDSSGATAIEYAVIIAVVVLIMLTGLMLVGDKTSQSFSNVADKVDQAM